MKISIECLWAKGNETEIADSWEVYGDEVKNSLDNYLENGFEIGEEVDGWYFKGFIIDGEFWTGYSDDYRIIDYKELYEEDKFELWREENEI